MKVKTADTQFEASFRTSGMIAGLVSFVPYLGFIIGIVLAGNAAMMQFQEVLPLLYVCAHIFRIKARDSYRNVRIRLAALNTFLQENVTGMSVVQIFNRERGQFRRFSKLYRDLYDAHIQSVLAYAVFYPGVELRSAVAIALIIAFGGLDVIGGAMTVHAI